MYSVTTRVILVLCLGCILWGCKEPVLPVTYRPSDCGYRVPEIAFSDPATCSPMLTTFTNPSAKDPTPADQLPALPGTCYATGASRVAYLDGIDDGSFFLHVYKGLPGPLTVQVFGQRDCEDSEPVSECFSVEAVAARFEITFKSSEYSSFYVRVAVDDQYSKSFSESNFVSLAAYEDKEPGSAGFIRYQVGGSLSTDKTNRAEADLPPLPFSCDGISFQRVLLSACEPNPDVVQSWIAELGIEPSEVYFGKKGNVVVFDVPPGMDPHTTGGSAAEVRSKMQGTDGTAEPDYLINLYNPRDPSVIASTSTRTPLATKDAWLQGFGPFNRGYFEEYLPRFAFPKPQKSGNPRIATIIDSGVDLGGHNDGNWVPTTYEYPLETEYVKPGYLGFDFIAKDLTPNDVAPHGSYVASTLLGQYTSDEDLDLVHMKTFGEKGISTYFGVLVSIYEATAIGSDIINMSWGISQPLAPEALTCAIETALNDGIYLFTSAGNDSLDVSVSPLWPANYAAQYPGRVVTAASYWYEGQLASRKDEDVHLVHFTNYSSKTVPMAGYMTAPVPEVGTGDIIFPLGTSFTSPQVAGRYLNWVAWNRGGTLPMFQSLSYSKGANLAPYVIDSHYLPVSKIRGRP